MATTKLEQSTALQTMSTVCKTIGWDVSIKDALWWYKVSVSGITDCLNTLKNKSVPVAVLVQDLKGNKIIAAYVQYVPAEDNSDSAAGSWVYAWTWDMNDIPEDTTVYTVDQQQIQDMIIERGYNMCNLTMATRSFVSQLCVYAFNILHDTLDQQAVAENETWEIELDGYFVASVTVESGQKVYSFVPKGEMKMLIKDDSVSEK